MVRRLTPDEFVCCDEVSPMVRDGARVVQLPFLAPGVSGMTLGRFVFIRSDIDLSNRSDLLVHELVHLEQYRAQGVVGFLAGYVGSYLRNLLVYQNHRDAYRSIPAEREAHLRVDRWRARGLQ